MGNGPFLLAFCSITARLIINNNNMNLICNYHNSSFITCMNQQITESTFNAQNFVHPMNKL
jgi:hypothetical protein